MQWLLVVLLAIGQAGQQRTSTIVLNVEAGLVYRRDVQPVAREVFYLLKESTSDIVQKEFAELSEIKNEYSLAMSLLYPNVRAKAVERWEVILPKYQVATFKTGFDGKATVRDVPKGDYWLFGVTRTRAGFAFWNLALKLDKDSLVVLDQNNAVYAK